ncbi:hypothetical protein J2Z30_007427 [Streptomyces iranensis]|uniref:Uncharacterized protein n=1 Tax=Streptomyces iranensis TaxID=576784 RepID=A0ABS4N301_9ACTN|nr:hypothetical protein [Streptomyces iranensis]
MGTRGKTQVRGDDGVLFSPALAGQAAASASVGGSLEARIDG